MKLLIDNQLPEALAEFLVANGIEARHVRKPALLGAFSVLFPELRAGLENGAPVIEVS